MFPIIEQTQYALQIIFAGQYFYTVGFWVVVGEILCVLGFFTEL